MKSDSLLFTLFPPPRVLLHTAAGIDISDRSVKVITLTLKHGHVYPGVFGEEVLAPGIVEHGKIVDPAKLTEVLRKMKEAYALSYVAVGLPEEEAFLFSLPLPPIKERQIPESVLLQLENHIPLPAPDAAFDYEIHSFDPEKGYVLGVTAISKAHVNSYLSSLTAAGLTPLALEIESHALARAIVPRQSTESVLVVDFGKTRAGVTVVSKGVVRYTATVANVGGEDITTAVQKVLGIERGEAEKIKMEKGLSRGEANKALFTALIPIVSVLKDEIGRHLSYWNTRTDMAGTHETITRAYLTGGQSTLPGLAEYLSVQIDIPVAVGNPWQNVSGAQVEIPSISLNEALRYTTSIGLALRSLRPEFV